MLVDPNTGLPIEESVPNPSRLSGRLATGVLEDAGLNKEELPFMYDLLSSMPSVTHTTAWNMGRVSNTLIGGGANQRGLRGALTPNATGQGGILRQGIPQTFGPRHFRRLTSAANIDPANNGTYTPFGFAAKAGNRVAARADRTKIGRDLIARVAPGYSQEVGAFSSGTFGRMASMARVGSLSGDSAIKAQSNLTRTLNELRPGTGTRLGQVLNRPTMFSGFPTSGYGGAAIRSSAMGAALDPAGAAAYRTGASQGAIGSTIGGSISGRAAGYFQGAQAARIGSEAGIAGLREGATLGSRFFSEGVETGITRYGAGSGVAKIAGSRGAAMGLRAAGPIGWILLAHDVARMTGKVVAGGMKTMVDAGNNVIQPLNKGIMGGTFKDNSVAATSRQRGVMAISASRLNARSVLGNEAAGLAAHFG